ncbi:hypothetical protein [Curvibacter gracilis]|uniref:hypothetical protein n=1 Tax=Curvibacter gracilis TaxID=230310 RepID=UPI0012F7CB3E|nr:hypothetical protein [Curvibacter gracilis]
MPSLALPQEGKKKPGHGPGQEAFLLSHIKAPAQGGKAGSSKLPRGNLAKSPPKLKQEIQIYTRFRQKKAAHPHKSPYIPRQIDIYEMPVLPRHLLNAEV